MAILVPAAIVAGFIVAGVVMSDLRLLFVALIVLFIAVPMVMAIGYFSIALSPEATRATLLHTVELLPSGTLRIVYLPLTEEEPPRVPFPPEFILREQIKSFEISGHFLIFRLTTERLVIIPIDALNLPSGWYCHFRDFA